jgi:hypothetical protein
MTKMIDIPQRFYRSSNGQYSTVAKYIFIPVYFMSLESTVIKEDGTKVTDAAEKRVLIHQSKFSKRELTRRHLQNIFLDRPYPRINLSKKVQTRTVKPKFFDIYGFNPPKECEIIFVGDSAKIHNVQYCHNSAPVITNIDGVYVLTGLHYLLRYTEELHKAILDCLADEEKKVVLNSDTGYVLNPTQSYSTLPPKGDAVLFKDIRKLMVWVLDRKAKTSGMFVASDILSTSKSSSSLDLTKLETIG